MHTCTNHAFTRYALCSRGKVHYHPAALAFRLALKFRVCRGRTQEIPARPVVPSSVVRDAVHVMSRGSVLIKSLLFVYYPPQSCSRLLANSSSLFYGRLRSVLRSIQPSVVSALFAHFARALVATRDAHRAPPPRRSASNGARLAGCRLAAQTRPRQPA